MSMITSIDKECRSLLAAVKIILNQGKQQNHLAPFYNYQSSKNNYIPRRKSGIYWIQVRRAAAAAAVEISLWTR